MELKEKVFNHEIAQISTRLFFSVLISCNLVVPTLASEVSLRIKGMGSELSGIISDPETDILWNPSRLMELEEREVLLAFEPGGSSRFKESQNLTFSLKGFFPRLISSQLGFGFWGEGSEEEIFSMTEEVEKKPSPYYSYPIVRDFGLSRTDTRDSQGFLLAPFLSWSPSSRTRFGIGYGYDSKPIENLRETNYWSTEFDPFISDTIRIYQSINNSKYDITRTFHHVKMGTGLGFNEKTSLEFIGQMFLSQNDTTNLSYLENLDLSKSSWVQIWADSTGNYKDSTSQIYNNNQTNVKNQYLFHDSQEFSLGFKISRILSGETALRFIGDVRKGIGDITGSEIGIFDLLSTNDYLNFQVADTETTYFFQRGLP